MISGCSASSARSTRAGPCGRRRPCSQSGQAELPLPEIQRNLRGYLTEAARTDVRLLDDAAIPSPAGVERLLRSLARNVATEASMSTLGANAERLMGDMTTLGLLFESLVVRDLRILAQPYDGRVAHLRDAAGTEADAIVDLPDGRWLAAEIKLGGGDAIEAAAQSLRRVRDSVAADRAKHLVGRAVITALGFAYARPDGVHVTPITALGP